MEPRKPPTLASSLIRQRQRSNDVFVKSDGYLRIDIFRIEFQYFTMMIDGVVAIAQCGEVAAFDGFFERCFETFGVREEVECFDVLWFLLEFCFRQAFCFACEIAKLSHDLWINFIVAAGVEGFRTVKRTLQASRLVKRFDPHARGEQLIATRMVWDQFDDLFEITLGFVVVDVVERIETTASQFFEPRAFRVSYPWG